MKRTVLGFFVLIICAAVFTTGCKKSEKALLEDEMKKSGNAAINKEIGDLRGKLSSAKDDFQKSEITGQIAALEAEKGDLISSVKSANESIKLYPGLAKPHYVLGKSYLAS